MAAIDLVTLQMVKDYLQKSQGDTGQDSVLQALVTNASRAILTDTQREIVSTVPAGTTRSFAVTGQGYVNLAPYDLQTATAVVVGTETATPSTLDPTRPDYLLVPVTKPQGVYLGLRLSAANVQLPTSSLRDFGQTTVQITGTWGWPIVPEDIQHACLITIRMWFRGHVAAYTETMVDVEPLPVQRLPAGARALLDAYRRPVA